MYNFLNMMSKIKNVVFFMDSLCYILIFKGWATGGQPWACPRLGHRAGHPWPKFYRYKISKYNLQFYQLHDSLDLAKVSRVVVAPKYYPKSSQKPLLWL